MKRPTFVQGVVVAALLGLVASAVTAAFLPFIGTVAVARLLIPALALAYILWLLSTSGQRSGRVTIVAMWSAMAVATWWLVPSFALYLLIHSGAIWLIRALYFYAGIIPALMDLGLSGLSVTVALGTLLRTGSVFLAAWSFFLTQALFVVIPATLTARRSSRPPATNDEFERSRRQAEAALRQLITQ